MNSLSRVERKSSRTCRGQSRRQLLANQPRFTHTRDDHAAEER